MAAVRSRIRKDTRDRNGRRVGLEYAMSWDQKIRRDRAFADRDLSGCFRPALTASARAGPPYVSRVKAGGPTRAPDGIPG
jgi:hypothetical protein